MFDVDDTLYDHLLPFQKSVEAYFPKVDCHSISDIYRRFRYWSDVAFPDYMSSNITIEELRIFRCKNTMIEFGVSEVTDEEAFVFQKDYEKQLNHIILFPEVKLLLEKLTEQNIPIAIITNSPVTHQMRKLEQLGALQYFNRENIIISQGVGFQKPQKEIFNLASERFRFVPNKTLYIGDTFENDIEGSYQAGWKSAWFNHRQRQAPAGQENLPNFEIHTPEELNSLITKLISH